MLGKDTHRQKTQFHIQGQAQMHGQTNLQDSLFQAVADGDSLNSQKNGRCRWREFRAGLVLGHMTPGGMLSFLSLMKHWCVIGDLEVIANAFKPQMFRLEYPQRSEN